MNTELVGSALAAHGRRLVVLDDGEVDGDLVRDMVEVLVLRSPVRAHVCAEPGVEGGRMRSVTLARRRLPALTGRVPVRRAGGRVVMAKVGELRRAAQELGVASTTLRQQGWKTASAERVQAVKDKPPEWLIEARERRRQKKARQRRLGDREDTAARLGVQVRAVKERGIEPSAVEGLMVSPPDWLAGEQARRQAQAEREAKDRLRRDLTDALVTSVHDAWFQELKRAISGEEAGAIDARWTPEVDRAKHEAQQLADELTPEQVRARIEREQDAAHDAAVYRASQLARRAFGGERG